jgi:predicted amidophosphoribosyltransferase
MFGDLIDFFLPKKCVICGEKEVDLCKNCERDLGLASQICPMCEEESVMGWTHKNCLRKTAMDGLICLFEYGDPWCVKRLMQLSMNLIEIW